MARKVKKMDLERTNALGELVVIKARYEADRKHAEQQYDRGKWTAEEAAIAQDTSIKAVAALEFAISFLTFH